MPGQLGPPPDGLAQQRRERLRSRLELAPFDWLVLAQPENIAYASGYRSVVSDLSRSHAMAAVVGVEDLWLCGPAGDSAPAIERGAVSADRFEPYGQFFFEFPGDVPAWAVTNRHADLRQAVGVVLDGIPASARVAVDARAAAVLGNPLPGEHGAREASDATGWLLDLRAVKLPGEVARLGRAASLAEAGIDAALDLAKPGVTEIELARAVAGAMVAGGGMPRFVVVTSGERSALGDARPTWRRLEPGDLVRFDVGCVVDGYWSDIGRTAVVGEPDGLQASRYAAILAGEEAQLSAARAGMTAGELFRVAVDTVEARGLAPYRRHHCGHAIGTEVYEQPVISPGVGTVLEPGMVFCVETPYYEVGWGGMMVEDTLVVTDAGCDLLSHSSRDLRVIDG